MSGIKPLTKIIKYSHISMLKKYNFQNHYRYKGADKYIAEHNFEHIKTYKDFCTKPERADEVYLTLTQQQQQYIHSTFLYERKGVAWTRKVGLPHHRPDDNQLQQSVQNKTLLSFIKQGINQRKPHQKLFFYLIAAIIINSWLYFNFWYGTDNFDYESNRSLNPQFMETYNLVNFQAYLKEYKRKMGVQLDEIWGRSIKQTESDRKK